MLKPCSTPGFAGGASTWIACWPRSAKGTRDGPGRGTWDDRPRIRWLLVESHYVSLITIKKDR